MSMLKEGLTNVPKNEAKKKCYNMMDFKIIQCIFLINLRLSYWTLFLLGKMLVTTCLDIFLPNNEEDKCQKYAVKFVMFKDISEFHTVKRITIFCF